MTSAFPPSSSAVSLALSLGLMSMLSFSARIGMTPGNFMIAEIRELRGASSSISSISTRFDFFEFFLSFLKFFHFSELS